MKKKTTAGAIGAAAVAALSGLIWWNSGDKETQRPRPRIEPECAANISYPEKITAKRDPKDGLWKATVNIKPPNAPCWISYTPVATDNKGAQARPTGTPVIIHIE